MSKNPLGFPILSQSAELLGEPFEIDIESILHEYTNFDLPLDLSPPAKDFAHKLSLPPESLNASSMYDFIDGCARELIPHLEQIEAFAEFWLTKPTFKPTLVKQSGWTRYGFDGSVVPVTSILEDVFVLDCETGVKLGGVPNGGSAVLVTVTSIEALYVWIHPSLINVELAYKPIYPSVGINKVIIAHNSAFDCHRILESLQLANPINFWMCTMSMHMVVSGLMSAQRFWFMEKNPRYVPAWASAGCMNNLVDCWNFYASWGVDYKWEYKETTDEQEIKRLKDEGWEVC